MVILKIILKDKKKIFLKPMISQTPDRHALIHKYAKKQLLDSLGSCFSTWAYLQLTK
jgi:hypothetical protein